MSSKPVVEELANGTVEDRLRIYGCAMMREADDLIRMGFGNANKIGATMIEGLAVIERLKRERDEYKSQCDWARDRMAALKREGDR